MKRCLAVAVALILALAFAPATNASQSPAGCTGSNPVVRFATETMNQLDSFVRPGDSIILGARISNMGSSACDLSEMTVTVQLPAPDGTPGEVRTVASDVDIAAGGVIQVPTESAPTSSISTKASSTHRSRSHGRQRSIAAKRTPQSAGRAPDLRSG